eukprot:TRINITY_DN11431_c0_g1_i2.p1 TRINITY_DN11431_c0_g1~~TRINITY_DN11431_c0_g1_i2.p1  ORF type:complete len:830 (+),score=88.75 TRINITY_DN11431_c0_g1_i2:1088-3577(+)
MVVFDSLVLVLQNEHRLLCAVWLANVVVLGHSACAFAEDGEELTYSVVCSSLSLLAVNVLLLLAQAKPELLGGRLRWVELVLLCWWVVVIFLLTFRFPFYYASNGYFGAWAALICTYALAAVHFKRLTTLGENVSVSLVVIFAASVVLTLQCALIPQRCMRAVWPYVPLWQHVDRKRDFHGPETPVLALVCGVLSSVASLGAWCMPRESYHPPLLLAIWTIGICGLTFHGPFSDIGNGYLACWTAWFASARLVAKTSDVTWQTRLRDVAESFRSPEELIVLVLSSLVVVVASAIACFTYEMDSSSARAFAIAVMACALAIGVLCARRCQILNDLSVAKVASAMCLLWTVGAGCTILQRPFRVVGNGFLGSVVSLVASSMLVKRNASLLGWQESVSAGVAYIEDCRALFGAQLAAALLLLQSFADCINSDSFEGGSGLAALFGVSSLLVMLVAAALKRVSGLAVVFRACVLLNSSGWCFALCRLTFLAPYVFVDIAFLSCWVGFFASGILLRKEWRTFVQEETSREASKPVPIPRLVQVIPSAPRASDSFHASSTFERKGGWGLRLVDNPDELAALRSLLHVPDPNNLGKGRDVRERDKYTELHVVNAWRIHKPEKMMVYDLKKTTVSTELTLLRERGILVPEVTTKLDSVAGRLVTLDGTVNEKLLLHGTKPESALSILHNGLNEKLSGGLFGKGVYMAEDPSKVDQYCTRDSKLGEGEPSVVQFQELLYDDRAKHEGNMYYCFVARTVLGCPILTRDGETSSACPEQKIFASDEKRELATIPDSCPPMHYHALVAEAGKGCKVVRHREFALFEGDRIALEYVVAYQRR